MLIVVSDLHVGATTALWPEGIQDGDGADLPPNIVQRELMTYWLDFIEAADREARRRGERPALLINGDLVQGAHPERDGQLMSDDLAVQAKASLKTIEWLVTIADVGTVYVNRGTGFHDGRNGGTAEAIAERLGAVRNPANGHSAHWHQLLTTSGKLVDATHHISMARVFPKNPLQKIVQRAKQNHAERGVALPDIFIRSHVHAFEDYGDGLGRYAFTTDPWQVPGEFAHKAVPGVLPIVGGLWLNVEANGYITWQRYNQLVSTAMPFQS